MVESIKILLLGVIVYLLSPRLFFRLGGHWFPGELRAPNPFTDRVTILRQRFWWAFSVVFGLIAVVLAGSYFLDSFPNGPRNWLRIVAVGVALTATLGRGGRGIETFPQETIIERIDRDMLMIAQLGATTFLLIALGL